MKYKTRPRIKIESKASDYFIESLGIVILAVLTIMPAYFYNQLPGQLPSHYNFAGKPDAYGSRGLIWILSLIGMVEYIVLSVVSRFPHTFNYPVPITPENVYKVYSVGVRSMRILKVALVFVFAILNFRTIQIGVNMHLDYRILLLLVVFFCVCCNYAYCIVSNGKKNQINICHD